MPIRRIIRRSITILLLILITGYLGPQTFSIPVLGATNKSYHPNSFWFYPWGSSGTHKGIDIFAKVGTGVVSSTAGLVVYKGTLEKGGNVIIVLGPKWRLHYYAHLKEWKVPLGRFVSPGTIIGTVGNTGNASGKPSHLHYSISSIIPVPWRIDNSKQGWKKMFYLNPSDYLTGYPYVFVFKTIPLLSFKSLLIIDPVPYA